MRADTQDIAAATVSGVEVLACWNFRRMVNLSRIRRYDEVNWKMAYPPVEIQYPMELANED